MGIFDSIFGSKPKKKQSAHSYRNDFLYEEVRQQAKRQVEGNSRLRIINDSLSLIEKTKNLSTLNSRYELVCEHLQWMTMQVLSYLESRQ